MRPLAPELLAAQVSASAVPHLVVTAHDRIGGVRRLAFERLYSGEEPDFRHAAVLAGDGSLIRARVWDGTLYYQRVEAPDPESNFSAWTDLGAAANADVALCAEGSDVLLFYVDADGTAVRLRESVDNGETLGSAVTVASASGDVVWLAADVKPGGDALVLYSVDGTVFAVERQSGSWGSPAAWTNDADEVSGLACFHHGDWNVAVTGERDGGRFVWSAIYGDGFAQSAGTWSALREIMRASDGAGVQFRAPSLSRPDVFRLTFIEEYAGSGAYSRPYHSHAPATADYAANLWREPVPFDADPQFGLAVAFSAEAVWLSMPSGVWRADLDVPVLDATADVLDASLREFPLDGRARITLRNDDGRYSQPHALLRPGGEVRVEVGYATSVGPLTSGGRYFWVESVEHRTGGGEASVTLEARDGWSLLEGWRARRQFEWEEGEENVFGIIRFLFARAGLEFSSIGSSEAASGRFPAFTVHPGESGLTAARRLLATVPDVVLLRGEFALLKKPLASEEAAYAYGGEHALLSGRYVSRLTAANRVQVFGRDVFGERFHWAGVEAAYDRLRQVHDLNVTTESAAEARADAVLRDEAIASRADEITVPVNCGQELYDVIEVTDPLAGLAAARRRILGMTLRYATGERPGYEQRLLLGEV